MLFRIDATSAGYTPDKAAQLHARLRERLAAVPGVQAATFSSVALLSRVRQNRSITVPGATPAPDAPRIVNTNGLAVNFFAAMELPVLIGRAFTERDDAAAPSVAIVNQTFARLYFGRESPMGRQIVFSGPGGRSTAEIVGVAGDAKYTDLRSATPPTIYMPALQMPDATVSFAVRAAGNPGALFPAIRAVVRDVDPTLPVLDLRTQDEQIDRLHAQERLFARLSGFFGLVALALACVGLHGLMSYAVHQRTGEIGLRMALGARPGQVLRMMLRESLAPGLPRGAHRPRARVRRQPRRGDDALRGVADRSAGLRRRGGDVDRCGAGGVAPPCPARQPHRAARRVAGGSEHLTGSGLRAQGSAAQGQGSARETAELV